MIERADEVRNVDRVAKQVESASMNSGAVAEPGFCSYINMQKITFDPEKRARTLAERGLDFAEAELVFEGINVANDDVRRPYGEQRVICYGSLRGRLVVIVYTVRGGTRHIISMRKGNARELRRIGPALGL